MISGDNGQVPSVKILTDQMVFGVWLFVEKPNILTLFWRCGCHLDVAFFFDKNLTNHHQEWSMEFRVPMSVSRIHSENLVA